MNNTEMPGEHCIIPAQDTADIKLPTLKHGDRGTFVVLLQTLLINRGYLKETFDTNGLFEDITLNSVIEFQRDWGLEMYGIVDSDTWNLLETSPERKNLNREFPY